VARAAVMIRMTTVLVWPFDRSIVSRWHLDNLWLGHTEYDDLVRALEVEIWKLPRYLVTWDWAEARALLNDARGSLDLPPDSAVREDDPAGNPLAARRVRGAGDRRPPAGIRRRSRRHPRGRRRLDCFSR
jgi:hypothetical protein